MTTVYGILKSSADPIYLLFAPNCPDEITLLMFNFEKFMNEIVVISDFYEINK